MRLTDTGLSVDVLCFETRTVRTVTAADFPGQRIAVKLWWPSGCYVGQAADEQNVDWRFLVSSSNGFEGNSADDGQLTRGTLGTGARRVLRAA